MRRMLGLRLSISLVRQAVKDQIKKIGFSRLSNQNWNQIRILL